MRTVNRILSALGSAWRAVRGFLFHPDMEDVRSTLFVGFVLAIGFSGGRIFFGWAKWTLLQGAVFGLGFAVMDDAYHSIKRRLRDRAWPWIKSLKK